jgi:cytochrome c-type biogenesis protein CcmE
MKRIYLVAGVMVAIAIALLINSAKDMSTYGSFADASSNSRKIKIAGKLSKDKPMVYDPVKDPNHFSFFIKDTKGEEHKVVLLKAKPQDFEMSEQIVVTGRMKEGVFVATDLLMKCPSKYKDEEIALKSKQNG